MHLKLEMKLNDPQLVKLTLSEARGNKVKKRAGRGKP